MSFPWTRESRGALQSPGIIKYRVPLIRTFNYFCDLCLDLKIVQSKFWIQKIDTSHFLIKFKNILEIIKLIYRFTEQIITMSKTPPKSWSREELILAINLYCKTPFGKIHYHNPQIIELAEYLGRTPGSVSYKLANFASIDPSLERKGASNYSKLDKQTWEEFFNDWNKMAFESEQIMIRIIGDSFVIENEPIFPEGKTKESIVKTRVNQSFFRQMILTSYDSKCCITGLPIKELLVASHIIPWSQNSKTRIDPQNGLCLNSLHDKAFDQGYITINTSNQVVISSILEDFDQDKVKLITNYKGVNIKLPHRFLPKQEYLNYHRENIFRA